MLKILELIGISQYCHSKLIVDSGLCLPIVIIGYRFLLCKCKCVLLLGYSMFCGRPSLLKIE